jgi:hypothetical protein
MAASNGSTALLVHALSTGGSSPAVCLGVGTREPDPRAARRPASIHTRAQQELQAKNGQTPVFTWLLPQPVGIATSGNRSDESHRFQRADTR